MTNFVISKHGRFWAVRDPSGELVCVCVYKRGAMEVVRRLSFAGSSGPSYLAERPLEISREAVRGLSETASEGE